MAQGTARGKPPPVTLILICVAKKGSLSKANTWKTICGDERQSLQPMCWSETNDADRLLLTSVRQLTRWLQSLFKRQNN